MSPVVHWLGLTHCHCWGRGFVLSLVGQLKSVRHRARRGKKKVRIQWWEPLSTDCLLTRYSSQLISPPLALPLSGTERPDCSKDPSAWCPRSTVPSGKEAQVSVSPRITWSAGVAESHVKYPRNRNHVHPQLSFFLGLKFCKLIWERNFHKWDSGSKGKMDLRGW